MKCSSFHFLLLHFLLSSISPAIVHQHSLGVRKLLLLSTRRHILTYFHVRLWLPLVWKPGAIPSFHQNFGARGRNKEKWYQEMLSMMLLLFSDLILWCLFHSCQLSQPTPHCSLAEFMDHLKQNLLAHTQLPTYTQSCAVGPGEVTDFF